MSETSSSWIFVLGSPRSGTSLLRRILSSHRRLYVSPELRVLELIQLAGALAGDSTGAFGPREIALGRAYARLMARHQLGAMGRVRYGDKFPPYCLSVPSLDKLFPDAKFVHIIRDGRDVVSSLAHTRVNNRGWRREVDVPPTSSLAADWAVFVGQARRAGLALGPERYHELRYEHLTEQPVPVLRELMGFLGEEMEGSLLEGMGEIKPGKSWRQTLAPSELLAFHEQAAARQLAAELGYPPTPLPADSEEAGETPAQARYLRGEEDTPLWFTLGEEALAAGKKSAAIAHFVRAVRGPDPHPGALARLLAFPQAPESVFAAMNARYSGEPALARAVADWAVARGLSPAAAEALFAMNEMRKGEAA